MPWIRRATNGGFAQKSTSVLFYVSIILPLTTTFICVLSHSMIESSSTSGKKLNIVEGFQVVQISAYEIKLESNSFIVKYDRRNTKSKKTSRNIQRSGHLKQSVWMRQFVSFTQFLLKGKAKHWNQLYIFIGTIWKLNHIQDLYVVINLNCEIIGVNCKF